MIEIKEPKQFIELYNRFIFRNRMFLKSKKSDEMIYFSHPFEDSIIYIRKKRPEEESQEIEENVDVNVAEDDDLFDEYDRYGDDEDDVKTEEKPEEKIVDNSIESKFLRYSIDDRNTWNKYSKTNIINSMADHDVYICDIFGYFCYKLNVFNFSILMAEFQKVNSEYEYYYDVEIFNNYYTKSEENLLYGVKVLPDSNGNILSKENVKFNAVEFYGEKFTEKFMELNSDNMYKYVAEELLERKQKHLETLNNFTKETPTITIFDATFTIEENEEDIAFISAYNKLGAKCCEEHDCLSWFKEDLDKLHLPENESYLEELQTGIGNFGSYLNNYFDYISRCNKQLQTDSTLKDAYNAIEFFDEDPLYHPKNGGTFSSYLAEKLKLQFINYMNILFEDFQSFSKEYEKYKESTGDYSGSFIGGGFGVKGALKGMLTSSVANAIESGVHQAIEFHSIEHKYVLDNLKEFARTQASKDFLLKLMEIDCKLMTYALPAFLEDKIEQFFNEYTGKEEDERYRRINDYFEASKYYTVYLAKKYNLKYIPRYQDDNGKKLSSFSNKVLLEKAITTFPFETEYYTEYINICESGKTPFGLAKLMKVFDVNEELINQVEVSETAEKERLLAEQQAEAERLEIERKAREEWEAAEKARLEEERKQREAELQKKYDELAAIYGTTYSKHEDIFKPLIYNDVFLAFFKKNYSSTAELIKDVDEYIKTRSIISAKLLTNTSPKFKTMLQKAKNAYVNDIFNDDDALIMFDATIFGNAKNGFIITKDSLYSNGLLTNPKKKNFEEIEILTTDLDGVTASKKGAQDTSDFISLPGAVGEVGKIITSFIANLYYINDVNSNN